MAGELEGVMGHELDHLQNRNILISPLAAAMAWAIMGKLDCLQKRVGFLDGLLKVFR